MVSRELGISREEQDAWALRSHQRAAAAQDAGTLRRRDRGGRRRQRRRGHPPRHDARVTREVEARLRPGRDDNCGQCAGCQRRGVVRRRHLGGVRAAARPRVLGTIVSQGYVADDFAYLVRTPANAAARAFEKAGKTIDDVNRVEINEAFSSVALNSTRLLGADEEIVNVNGGARRARASDRRLGRADRRHDGARAPAQRRRARARGDLLRRRPGRRPADRGLIRALLVGVAALALAGDALACSCLPVDLARDLPRPTVRSSGRCSSERIARQPPRWSSGSSRSTRATSPTASSSRRRAEALRVGSKRLSVSGSASCSSATEACGDRASARRSIRPSSSSSRTWTTTACRRSIGAVTSSACSCWAPGRSSSCAGSGATGPCDSGSRSPSLPGTPPPCARRASTPAAR